MEAAEQNGMKFDLQKYLQARQLCRDVVQDIAAQVPEGCRESDGQALIKDCFRKVGVTKFWHPSKFRIASDTTKTFRAAPDPALAIKPGEIFFIDVGPVIDDHEADFGESFVFQPWQHPGAATFEPLVNASAEVWRASALAWKTQRLTGQDLYAFASDLAKSRGLDLNPGMSGHRLGDFPHALHSKDSLSSRGFVPSENLWVLEIHLIHREWNRGAFFEDILREL